MGYHKKAAGLAIGIVGDAGVRANAQQDKIFVGMILILIFAEALGLYGLIIALILSQWERLSWEQCTVCVYKFMCVCLIRWYYTKLC